MFSATGSILKGMPARPDIHTIAYSSRIDFIPPRLRSNNCTLDRLAILPGISSVTGFSQTLLGIVHSIVHLSCAIFDAKNRKQHLQETSLGGRKIVTGFIAMIPFIGNLAMYAINSMRINKFEKQIKKEIQSNQASYRDSITLFANGKMITTQPSLAVDDEIRKRELQQKLSQSKLINLLKAMGNIRL